MEIAEKQKNGRANEKQHRQQQKQNMESKSNQLSNENSTTVQGSTANLEFSLHVLDQRVIQRRQGGFICPTFPISTFLLVD
jgi:hypothetical protein